MGFGFAGSGTTDPYATTPTMASARAATYPSAKNISPLSNGCRRLWNHRVLASEESKRE